MSQVDISIIIPFYNEEATISILGAELCAFSDSKPELKLEFILVNDGSFDRSVSIIRASTFPARTKLISMSKNFGSHEALRAGIMHASGANITFLYADLQDPIDNVIRMFEKIEEGIEIVWAYRTQTQVSFFERKFSTLYSKLMRKYVNPSFPTLGFDVVMFSSKVAKELNKNIESNSSIFLQILNLGFKSTFIEYQKKRRTAGESKWTISKKIKLVIDSFIAFSYAPIRFVSLLGISFFLAGVLWTIYITTRQLLFDDLVAGWPMLTSILLLGFGVTNIALGIIAEYLWRTLDAARRRPVFIIDKIIDLDND
jgi:glycosyltransferase involved in cell wall biosynthesis